LYFIFCIQYIYYLCRCLGSESIVLFGVMYVCPLSHLYHVSTARHISLGSEGDALYPVLSRCILE